MPLQEDIGYRPSISMKEGTARTVAWLKEIQKN
jgi:nucleoside-diphosphate-sugar epimerase